MSTGNYQNIIDSVSKTLEVDVKSKRRYGPIIIGRQITIWLIKKHFPKATYQSLSNALDLTNHVTARHHYLKALNFIKTEKYFKDLAIKCEIDYQKNKFQNQEDVKNHLTAIEYKTKSD